MEDSAEFIARAINVFADESFADMRFRAADVQRAFEEVGYLSPTSSGEEFAEKAAASLDFLLDDDARRRLAQKLMLMLPDYVTQGRHLDAYLIWHSADVMIEPKENGVGSFLLAMFLHGFHDWQDQREQEQVEMFREMGLTLDEIRKMGPAGIDQWLMEVADQPQKMALLEKFLANHPELDAMSQGMSRTAEDAYIKLLERDDTEDLLVSPEEAEPWVRLFERRVTELPKRRRARMRIRPDKPDEKANDSVMAIAHSVSSEMAKAIFTPARLARLKSRLHDLRRKFSAEDDGVGVEGVDGALADLAPHPGRERSEFLDLLCFHSMWVSICDMPEFTEEAETRDDEP